MEVSTLGFLKRIIQPLDVCEGGLTDMSPDFSVAPKLNESR